MWERNKVSSVCVCEWHNSENGKMQCSNCETGIITLLNWLFFGGEAEFSRKTGCEKNFRIANVPAISRSRWMEIIGKTRRKGYTFSRPFKEEQKRNERTKKKQRKNKKRTNHLIGKISPTDWSTSIALKLNFFLFFFFLFFVSGR